MTKPDFATTILSGNEKTAYRDPACIYADGAYHLFFTLSVLDGEYMYNSIATAESADLVHWGEVREITERDRNLNFSSPGSIIYYKGEYYVSICSYPLPRPYKEMRCATEDARLYFIKTKDFKSYTRPEMIMAKGDTPAERLMRMIDSYVFEDKDESGLFHLFFKQNGVSHSISRDLRNWEYLGRIDGGENACVILHDGCYYLIHSPADGIGIKRSRDLALWEDVGVFLPDERPDFATGRLTAAFAMPSPRMGEYAVFLHGSKKDAALEIHGEASLAITFTKDFKEFYP